MSTCTCILEEIDFNDDFCSKQPGNSPYGGPGVWCDWGISDSTVSELIGRLCGISLFSCWKITSLATWCFSDFMNDIWPTDTYSHKNVKHYQFHLLYQEVCGSHNKPDPIPSCRRLSMTRLFHIPPSTASIWSLVWMHEAIWAVEQTRACQTGWVGRFGQTKILRSSVSGLRRVMVSIPWALLT